MFDRSGEAVAELSASAMRNPLLEIAANCLEKELRIGSAGSRKVA
jgi:hypothetical protein